MLAGGWPLGIEVEIEVDFDGLRMSKKYVSDWLTRTQLTSATNGKSMGGAKSDQNGLKLVKSVYSQPNRMTLEPEYRIIEAYLTKTTVL